MKENTVLSNIRRGFGGVASALVAIAVITLAGASEAATEKVGNYTWTYYIDGNTAVIYNDNNTTAVSPKPNGSLTIASMSCFQMAGCFLSPLRETGGWRVRRPSN